jgi:hypothetical protein
MTAPGQNVTLRQGSLWSSFINCESSEALPIPAMFWVPDSCRSPRAAWGVRREKAAFSSG